MSFNVFASGSGGFHFQHDGFVDGDDFDALKLASEVQGFSPTKLGAVDAVRNHFLSKDITDAITVIAQQEFLHTLKDSVDLLAIRAGSSDGFITVTSRKKHTLWPDTLRFAKYGFDPGDFPGSEFIRAIAQSLDDTGLKNWGVLMALTRVLSDYQDHLSDSDASVPTMINIFLTH